MAVQFTEISGGASIIRTREYQRDPLGRVTTNSVSFDDDGYGRVIQTTTYDPATGSTGMTRYVYNDGVCIQEIREDGSIAASRVTSDGAVFGITITGTNYFTHGGVTEPTTFKYPILKGDYIRMRDVEMDDDISLPVSRITGTTITSGDGSIVERWDVDQDGRPVFLSATGTPNADGSSSLGPLKWMAPELLWLPEVRLLHTPAGAFNPDLGRLCGKVSHF